MKQAKSLPWGRGVKIIKCDDLGLLAVDKPEGVMSHPNKKSENAKAVIIADYDLKRQVYRIVDLDTNVDTEVFLINRLDSATSGVLLLALNEKVASAALDAFAKKRVKKIYTALVFGVLQRGSPVWRDRLSVKRAEGGVRAGTGAGGPAETRLVKAEPIPGMPLMSRLTLMPITGKTHQLRVQAAKRRIPIVGDRTYGDFVKNKLVAKSKKMKRLCLHCMETELSYRIEGQSRKFKAVSRASF